MTNTEKCRGKLLNKLTELFHLDQPDLDFGFYRIMQAKAQQVKSFIDKDLLQIIEDAFGQIDESRKAELTAAYENVVRDAREEYGVPDPENTPKAIKAKAALDTLNDRETAEADVYDHLYRFFERYYDDGDFISRRYYARENAGKAAPFAIPYNGEEVKLHWANADQYYIKTAEYFSNYSFDITEAAEIRDMTGADKAVNKISNKQLKINFRIVDANEDEHGNVKAAENKKRFFILHEKQPVEFNDAGELVVNFEYKTIPGGKNAVDADTEKALKEKYGKSLNKRDMPNLLIADNVIAAAEKIKKTREYIGALTLYSPTDKIPRRPLLAKYINQYTARNTRDYFIHKDLDGFLKRELDFYIKNEVMHLDDIESVEAPAVESYLEKLKVIRKIAIKLIEFLAQIENFQKKLWLKKKFVTETNYCITLDRVPEELYEEITANDAQREEWVKLFAIDAIKGDARGSSGKGKLAYSVPLTTEFLKGNDKLVLDTAFFNDEFKVKLVASIKNFDEQCDGLLNHSENFQALNLLEERYREQVKCVYIDPPYNTGGDGFLYKDTYQHSAWMSLLISLLYITRRLQSESASISVSTDHVEAERLFFLLNDVYGENNRLARISIAKGTTTGQDANSFGSSVDYLSVYRKSSAFLLGGVPLDDADIGRFNQTDNRGAYSILQLRKTGNADRREDRPAMYYPIQAPDGSMVFPIGPGGYESRWRAGKEKFHQWNDEGIIEWVKRDAGWVPYVKYYAEGRTKRPSDLWNDIEADLWNDIEGNKKATRTLKSLFVKDPRFLNPKPVELIKRIFHISNVNSFQICLDFFAGSGTTGHAVINLNRKDNGSRKYILVEMGSYFDTVLKPRINKTIYSADWKNGKPASRGTGISHCLKYIRLESYEDTLNNLVFDDNPARNKSIESNPSVKEDYMLRYLLDVETQGSQSLLNINDFTDPAAYSLVVKKPGSDEQITQNIDLIETFNYLLGLRLENMAAPQVFTASFTRKPDPKLPKDKHTKLALDGKIQLADDGKWWFRSLEGWVPADPMNPNDGQKERVLIVWRKLTGNPEEDSLMLDEWLKKYRISTRSFEYDTIYTNGPNNLSNLKKR